MSKIHTFRVQDAFGLPEISENVTAIGYADTENPFIPSKDKDYVFRKNFLREVLAFLKSPGGDALFVAGPTGAGKTSGVCEIAARLNWPVQQLTAHGKMEFADLVGHHALVSPAPGQPPVMQFMYGALCRAMREGHILLINEVDMLDPSELSGLNDVLDGRPLVISHNGGEIIKPHSMFRVIATGNSTGAGDESGLYQGVLMQNIAAMDRYRFTRVDYMSADEEKALLGRVVPSLPPVIREGVVRVANEVRKLFVGDDNNGGMLSLTMSTRTLVRWAKLSMAFRRAPNALAYALEQALLARAKPEERVAILRVAKDVFGQQWGSDTPDTPDTP